MSSSGQNHRSNHRWQPTLAPKPERFFGEGVGAGRAPPGIGIYLTKLVQPPRGVPGHGKSTSGQSSTTSRADSLAIGSDFRAAGGTDEGGAFSTTDKPADRGTLPVPSPLITDFSSGGPLRADAGPDTNLKRPVSHKHVGEEGDSA
jgi:hypothetical protein